MDKIHPSVQCPECRLTLSDPVLLPCGNVICLSHTRVSKSTIMCAACGQWHPNKNFVVIKPFSMLIVDAEISKLDFGKTHAEAKKACDRLNHELVKVRAIINDLELFIHDTVNGNF